MARPLSVRQPHASEIRRLHQMLEAEPLDSLERRRVEALLLYADGFCVTDLADTLGAHANTIYHDLRAFHQHGLAAVRQSRRRGVKARLTLDQEATIARLAEQPPYELGLPYGRWSLSSLRAYLIKQKILKNISREHLRRVLKKRGSTCAGYGANFSAMIRNDQRFWPVFAGFGSTCQPTASWRSSTSSLSPSKPMEVAATRRPPTWCWRVNKKPEGAFIYTPCMKWVAVVSTGDSIRVRVPSRFAAS